jgi:hypothetical protein
MYKVPFRSLAIMYTNDIGKLQRHWTPAFAGVTLFGLVALKILGLSTFNLFGVNIFNQFSPIVLKL